MRYLLVVLVLTGCATPEQQKAAEDARNAAYRESLFRQCEAIGFQRNTDPIKQCVLTLHGQNVSAQQNQPAPQYRPRRQRTPSPVITTCDTWAGHTTCRTQ